MKPTEFISKIAEPAMEDMRRTGIPASLTIAQAILESAWGESGLTRQANNLFGIKGKGPAGSVTMPTKEFGGGKWINVDAAFRAYNNWAESIADHSALILGGTRDKPNRYHGVLWADYRTACHEIWRGGYATDPAYPQKLINLIETHALWKFDEEVREEAVLNAELKEIVKRLQQEMDALQQRMESLEGKASMPVPVWAEKAVQAAVDSGLIDTPEGGSYDFYRIITVLHRAGMLADPELGESEKCI